MVSMRTGLKSLSVASLLVVSCGLASSSAFARGGARKHDSPPPAPVAPVAALWPTKDAAFNQEIEKAIAECKQEVLAFYPEHIEAELAEKGISIVAPDGQSKVVFQETLDPKPRMNTEIDFAEKWDDQTAVLSLVKGATHANAVFTMTVTTQFKSGSSIQVVERQVDALGNVVTPGKRVKITHYDVTVFRLNQKIVNQASGEEFMQIRTYLGLLSASGGLINSCYSSRLGQEEKEAACFKMYEYNERAKQIRDGFCSKTVRTTTEDVKE